jgi:hypothetical protein
MSIVFGSDGKLDRPFASWHRVDHQDPLASTKTTSAPPCQRRSGPRLRPQAQSSFQRQTTYGNEFLPHGLDFPQLRAIPRAPRRESICPPKLHRNPASGHG